MNIQQIPPTFVCQLWPRIKGMLERALEHSGGEFTIDQLQFALVRGEQSLLVAMDGDAITGVATVAIDSFPAARIAFVTAVCGRMLANDECLSQLEDWSRANGCTKIRGACRESVARMWRQKLSFEPRYIIMEHAL